jgi:3',5'-cyclic AMP phosphodiesterase CpdA
MGGLSTSSDPASYVDSDEETVDQGLPYLDIFSLPKRGEAGGVASGTEQYYAFDYANVHVVSLDSQLSIRDHGARAAMKAWLAKDLAANKQNWTIVIFHHPPYSKSSHDSDEGGPITAEIDLPIVLIRKELTPIFEEFGVDIVYSGHSHTYERSWYLKGHRGNADTFDPALHAELGPNGKPTSGREPEAYHQVTTGGEDDRVVYIVAGASGLADREQGKLDHPAHFAFPDGRHGLEVSGAIVLDAGRDKLTSRYVDTTGTVVDELTIER